MKEIIINNLPEVIEKEIHNSEMRVMVEYIDRAICDVEAWITLFSGKVVQFSGAKDIKLEKAYKRILEICQEIKSGKHENDLIISF